MINSQEYRVCLLSASAECKQLNKSHPQSSKLNENIKIRSLQLSIALPTRSFNIRNTVKSILFLKKTSPEYNNFEVEKLATKGLKSSFETGVDFELKGKVMSNCSTTMFFFYSGGHSVQQFNRLYFFNGRSTKCTSK